MNDRVLIDCDKRLVLSNYAFIKDIKCTVDDYEQIGDTVTGNVRIRIEYLDKENNLDEFNELIPFDMTLLNNMIVDEINVINFNYYEIVNQGIQCNFQIDFKLKECDVNDQVKNNNEFEEYIDNVDPYEEEIKDKYDNLLDEIFNFESEDNFENQVEEIEEVKNDVNNDGSSDKSSDGHFEEPLEESLDDELDESSLLANKEDYDVNFNAIFLNDSFNVTNERVSLKNIKESIGTYRVYYPKEEKEIDKVCTEENVSLTSIYNKEFNKDFTKKKRIIIEK